MFSLRSKLLSGDTVLAVWGGGYVGLSTAIHFAAHGVRCHIHDTNPIRVENINAGRTGLPLFESWMQVPLHPLVEAGLVTATTGTREESHAVHVIAVPTEKNGLPWQGAIIDVGRSIMQTNPTLCIVESTVTPGTADKLMAIYPNLPLAIAPRRDWFLGEGKGLRTLPRVYAGSTPDVAKATSDILSIVSNTLLEASSCGVAELTKCLENSIHHLAALFATQVARAYSTYDVNEAFALAASHWRVGNSYFASAGTGGHCLPVATNHLIEAANEAELTICTTARQFEFQQRDYIADLLACHRPESVGVLGLSYRAEVPTTTLSPFVDVALRLIKKGIRVYVHDPYCASTVLERNPDLRFAEFLEILRRCRYIFLGAPHREYVTLALQDLSRYLKANQVILDNEGAWAHLRNELLRIGVIYRRIGDAGWTDLPK